MLFEKDKRLPRLYGSPNDGAPMKRKFLIAYIELPPEDEPFIVAPGGQGGAEELTPSGSSKELTQIFSFQIPPGLHLRLDPENREHEVLFQPFATVPDERPRWKRLLRKWVPPEPRFMAGEFDVLGLTATGGRSVRVHHSHTEYHRPTSSISGIGNRRRWHRTLILDPGDAISVRFRPDKKEPYPMDPKISILWMRASLLSPPYHSKVLDHVPDAPADDEEPKVVKVGLDPVDADDEKESDDSEE